MDSLQIPFSPKQIFSPKGSSQVDKRSVIKQVKSNLEDLCSQICGDEPNPSVSVDKLYDEESEMDRTPAFKKQASAVSHNLDLSF